MTLPIKEKTYLSVDSCDFGDAVAELLGVPSWECGFVDEMSNGSYMELDPDFILESETVFHYDVDTKVSTEQPTVEFVDEWVARCKSPDFNYFAERDNQPTIHTMFYYLYAKGHLALGDYLVKVWW